MGKWEEWGICSMIGAEAQSITEGGNVFFLSTLAQCVLEEEVAVVIHG